jgi:flagellar hook-length control protein FliK
MLIIIKHLRLFAGFPVFLRNLALKLLYISAKAFFMNTTMSLNNVLPVPAGRGAHFLASAKSSEGGLARNSSPYDAGSSKNETIQQDRSITPEETPSDNLEKIDSETQPKVKPARNTDFKNILNRQIKSQKPADESVAQQTDVKTPPLDGYPTLDGSQPVATPVTTNDASTTDSLIPDIAVAGDTAPATNTPPQVADNTPQTQIADTSLLDTRICIEQRASSIENQVSSIFEQQSPQPDSSQQTQPTTSNLPASASSQLITAPDKPNVSTQQKTENVVSPGPTVIRNPSSDNSIPNANLELKPVDIAYHKTPAEGQETQVDYSSSAHSASNTNSSKSADQNASILPKDQPDNPTAESPAPQAVNIAKTNPAPDSRSAKTREQIRLNQQSPGSSKNQQSAILNQQLNQPPVSQGKITASPEKSDTPKADLQNVNTASQIAPGQAIPESNANVTNTVPAKLPTEALRNLSAADNDPAAAIREQISQSVTTAAQQVNRQITIQLNPPELGKISVKFTQAGSELTGLLEVSNPQTRADINQQIPEIIRSLEQAGVTVKHIDVTLSDLPGRSNPDSQRDNSSQANWDRSAGNNYQDSPRQHFSSESFTTPSSYSAFDSRVAISGAQIHSSSSYVPSGLDVLI